MDPDLTRGAQAGGPTPEDDERLRREGERIEQLLGELDSMIGPQARQRLEGVVQRLTLLYGSALARLLDHAREARGRSGDLEERLCHDELLASLLLLHGLHPRPTAERVRHALDAAQEHFTSQGASVRLLAVENDRVRVGVANSGSGCGSAELERTLERVVQEAAPEVARVIVEGGSERLVQINLRRRAGKRP